MNRVVCRRYHVFLQLGGGAETGTWLALDLGSGQPGHHLVILQQIPGQPDLLQTITEQVRRASRLTSPVGARVLGLERDGESYFVVREFVYGESLASVAMRASARAASPPPLGLILATIAEVARLVHEAHSFTDDQRRPSPLVHGDLCPSKIFWTLDGSIRLLDLGITGTLNQRRQQSKSRPGSAMGYLAPEQCMGVWGDYRSDIFALGVILWEMLTGRRLYEYPNSFDVIRAICDEPAEAPSLFHPAVPPFLDSLVQKALAKDPAERFTDASQLASSLDRLMGAVGRPQAGDLSRYIQEVFPHRISQWESLSGLLYHGRSEDAVRLATSLLAPPVAERQEATAVRPHELERLRTQTLKPEVTSPTVASVPSKYRADAVGSDTEISAATSPMRGALGDDTRATAEMTDITLIDSLTVETQEVTAPRESFAVEPNPKPSIVPPKPGEPDVKYVNLGDLFAALDHIEAADDTSQISMSQAPAVEDERHAEPPQNRPSPYPESAANVPTSLLPLTPEVEPRKPRPRETPSVPAPAPSSAASVEGVARAQQSYDGSVSGPLEFVGWDDEEDDAFVEPFSMEEVIAPELRVRVLSDELHDSMPVVEILRVRDGRILDSEILRGLRRTFRPPHKRFTVKLKGKKALIDFAESGRGWIQRSASGESRESLDGHTGQVSLSVGEAAMIRDVSLTYYVRIFYPPHAPIEDRRQFTARSSMGFALAALMAIVLHAMGIAAGITVSAQLGLRLVVEEPPQPEIFAEGELMRPEPPKPPEPEPPKPREEPRPKKVEPRPADPTEQVVQIPKAVREQLDRRRRETGTRDTASSADNLLNTLASPVQGQGENLKDVVSNIDAIASPGSSAFRVGGTLAALEGDEVNVASGGGGRLGDLTGGKKTKDAGKLDARKTTGEVRGRVRATQALSRQQGEGSLSPGEVTAVINRHLGQIQGCYEAGLLRNSSLAGQITFEWTVNSTGNVSNAREISSTLGDGQVSNCIIGVIRRMKFPSPTGGDSVTIRYPFMFSSSS
jgi:eukaryotic-like serine/threonine-protein kinase